MKRKSLIKAMLEWWKVQELPDIKCNVDKFAYVHFSVGECPPASQGYL